MQHHPAPRDESHTTATVASCMVASKKRMSHTHLDVVFGPDVSMGKQWMQWKWLRWWMSKLSRNWGCWNRFNFTFLIMHNSTHAHNSPIYWNTLFANSECLNCSLTVCLSIYISGVSLTNFILLNRDLLCNFLACRNRIITMSQCTQRPSENIDFIWIHCGRFGMESYSHTSKAIWYSMALIDF